MGAEFTFYDYVDSQRNNPIRAWLDGVGPKAKARFTVLIAHLEATRPGDWRRPVVDTLHDDCAGLFEIRALVEGIQYRLLGFHGPGQRAPTLVAGAIERSDRFEPRDTPQIAQARKAEVENDAASHRKPHDFK